MADGVIQQTLAHEIHALESSRGLFECNCFASFGRSLPGSPEHNFKVRLASNPGLTLHTSVTNPRTASQGPMMLGSPFPLARCLLALLWGQTTNTDTPGRTEHGRGQGVTQREQ